MARWKALRWNTAKYERTIVNPILAQVPVLAAAGEGRGEGGDVFERICFGLVSKRANIDSGVDS